MIIIIVYVDITFVEKCLQKFEGLLKEFVFVLDAGRDMAKSRAIIKGVKCINELLPCLSEINDRVSYGLVTEEYRELIPLLKKKENEVFINRMLEFIPKPNCKGNNSPISL